MLLVITRIDDAMLLGTWLPNLGVELKFLFCTKREPAFNELHTFLQRLVGRGREDDVNMVTHDDEFMDHHATLRDVVTHDIDEELSHAVGLED